MDVLEAIRTRRSIRRYREQAVPRALVEELLDAARWAPSSHNRQPWRFAVIENNETKARLARAMGDKLRADLRADGATEEFIARDAGRSYERLVNAPVVIAACVTMRDMDSYPDARRSRAEYLMATQSVAMAVQAVLLAAHANGLGTCWMCAPLFVPDTVREVLGLDADWEPQALITLGYPAEERTKTRMALEVVVRFVDAGERG